MIRISNLSKAYFKPKQSQKNKTAFGKMVSTLINGSGLNQKRQEFFALKKINIIFEKESSLGIIGLNGSGKSTLLQIISGTLSKSFGVVEVTGKVASLLELGSGFNPDFTGIENIRINAALFGLSKRQIDDRINDITSFAEIGDFINQPVRTYSTGMYLRLSFAVIAHVDPEILIIDEALAVGDARFQLKCFSFLERFKDRGGKLILVSHDTDSIARLCSRVILLHEGVIVIDGSTRNVINIYSKLLSLGKYDFEKESISNHNIEQSRSEFLLDSNSLESSKYEELVKSMNEDHVSSNNEFSYGGENARIVKTSVFDNFGNESEVVYSGDYFTVKFEIHTYREIPKPTFAMTIKEKSGQQVYGQNTTFKKMPVKDLNAGEKIEVTFHQKANLGAGNYFISLGLTRFGDGGLEIIHRKYDTLELKVICMDGSFGLTNCYSEIKIKSIE
jgi:lipopolysaccharide transport system ATP-binding protein